MVLYICDYLGVESSKSLYSDIYFILYSGQHESRKAREL